MTLQIGLLLSIIMAAVVLFSLDRFRADLIAVGILVSLNLTGLLSPSQTFAGFGSDTVVMIFGLLVLTASMIRTGVIDYAGRIMDVMWRTLGNAGYLNQPIVDGKYQGIPVTLIQPGEELAGLPLLDLFNVHPKKSQRLIKLGYRDAKRILKRGRPASNRADSVARKVAAKQVALASPGPAKARGRARP